MNKSRMVVAVLAVFALAAGVAVLRPGGDGAGSPTAREETWPASGHLDQHACEVLLPASALTDLGWTPTGDVEVSTSRCDRSAVEGFVHVKVARVPEVEEPHDAIVTRCGWLAETEERWESPSTWLVAGQYACATNPRMSDDIVFASVLTDDGWLVDVSIFSLARLKPGAWRQLIGDLAHAAAAAG